MQARTLATIITLLLSCQAALALPPRSAVEVARRQDKNNIYMYISRGNYQRARTLLTILLRQAPEDGELHYLDGQLKTQDYAALGMTDEKAEEAFKKAATLWKGEGRPYFELGRIEYERDNRVKSLEYVQKALTAARPDPSAYGTRALLKSRDKKYAEALKDVDVFIKASPDNRQVGLDYKVHINESAGDIKGAIAASRELIKTSAYDTYKLKLATLLQKDNQNKEALAVLGDMIKNNARDDMARLQRARLSAKMGQYDAAARDYQVVVDEAPARSLYLERAEFYKKFGKTELYRRDMAQVAKM